MTAADIAELIRNARPRTRRENELETQLKVHTHNLGRVWDTAEREKIFRAVAGIERELDEIIQRKDNNRSDSGNGHAVDWDAHDRGRKHRAGNGQASRGTSLEPRDSEPIGNL